MWEAHSVESEAGVFWEVECAYWKAEQALAHVSESHYYFLKIAPGSFQRGVFWVTGETHGGSRLVSTVLGRREVGGGLKQYLRLCHGLLRTFGSVSFAIFWWLAHGMSERVVCTPDKLADSSCFTFSTFPRPCSSSDLPTLRTVMLLCAEVYIPPGKQSTWTSI